MPVVSKRFTRYHTENLTEITYKTCNNGVEREVKRHRIFYLIKIPFIIFKVLLFETECTISPCKQYILVKGRWFSVLCVWFRHLIGDEMVTIYVLYLYLYLQDSPKLSDQQPCMLTTTLMTQLWVRDTRKLSVAFSHAWLFLAEVSHL